MRIGFDIMGILHNIMKEYSSMKEGIDVLLNTLLENDIKAIFVFDGTGPKNELKLPKQIERRKNHRLNDYNFAMIQICAKYRDLLDECDEIYWEDIEKDFNNELTDFIEKSKLDEEQKYPDKGCFDKISENVKINKNMVNLKSCLEMNDSRFSYVFNCLERETKYATPKDIVIARNRIVDFIEQQYADFEVHTATGEADFFLANLHRNDLIDICISNDTDLIVLGLDVCIFFDCNFDSMVYINRSNLIKGIQKYYDINPNIRDMDKLFVNMAILCGSDYSPNIYIPTHEGFNQDPIINLLKYNSIYKIKKDCASYEKTYQNITQIMTLYDRILEIYSKH